MKKDEHIKTFIVNGIKVDLGIDDYGQCYFFEYTDPKTKKLETVCCGTYCTYYMEEIYGLLDPIYSKIERKELLRQELTKKEKDQLLYYNSIFKKEYNDYE